MIKCKKKEQKVIFLFYKTAINKVNAPNINEFAEYTHLFVSIKFNACFISL